MDTEMIQGIKLVVDMLSGLGLYSLVVLVIGIIAYAAVYISAFYFIPQSVVNIVREWAKGKQHVDSIAAIAEKGTVLQVDKHLITTDAAPILMVDFLESMKKDSRYIHASDIRAAKEALELHALVRNKLGRSEYADLLGAEEMLKQYDKAMAKGGKEDGE